MGTATASTSSGLPMETVKAKCSSPGRLGVHAAGSKRELLLSFPSIFKTLCSFCQMHLGYYQMGSQTLMSLLTKKYSRIFMLTSVGFKSLWSPKTCLKAWMHSFISFLLGLSPCHSRAEDQNVRLSCSKPE